MASPHPDHHVGVPVSLQRWAAVTFLHWALDPADVQARLPPGLEVDTFEGRAWVSITPFGMQVRIPPLPTLPGRRTFGEVNLRTYVRGSRGPGLWFLALDCARLDVTLTLRGLLGLPYHWAAIDVRRQGGDLRYRSRRRLGGTPAAVDVALRVGPPLPPAAVRERDHFLTARWRAYSTHLGRLLVVPVEHQPWPLCATELVHVEESLLDAAGLARPPGPALVHHSPGVLARFGPPRTAG